MMKLVKLKRCISMNNTSNLSKSNGPLNFCLGAITEYLYLMENCLGKIKATKVSLGKKINLPCTVCFDPNLTALH